MSTHPDIETLRLMVKRDQEFFKDQNHRLTEIQQSDPETLSDADKNSLSNWDKSVIKDCNHHLLLLEEIADPTSEERMIMQELNKLISLGDHIMERRNLVQAELNDRLNAMKKSAQAKAKPEATSPEGEACPVPRSTPAVNVVAADPSNDSLAEEHEASDSPHVTGRSSPNTALLTHVSDEPDGLAFDPKDLYAIIRVEPNAPLNEVKKAAKKATLLLHPDRNPDDPDAASRFASFQIACQAFETDETRREFDETGDVKAIPDLRRELEGMILKD